MKNKLYKKDEILARSHYDSIEYQMFSNLDQWNTPTVMNKGLEDIVPIVENLFAAISKLEPKQQ